MPFSQSHHLHTGMFSGDTRKRPSLSLLSDFQNPTGGQAGPIFAVLLQLGKGLSLQASFPSVIGCLSGVFKSMVVLYYFECVLVLFLFIVFLVWYLFDQF